jgi:iron complex transport system permease protein
LTSVERATVAAESEDSQPGVDFGYRRWVVGSDRASVVIPRRSTMVALALTSFSVAVGIVSLVTGEYPLTLAEVGDVVRGADTGFARTVVLEWRLPRVLAAILLGGALALSGAIFQTMTRNPLASPDVIGLSNGAFAGMLLTLLWMGSSWAQVTVGSVLGGLATAIVIYLLAHRGGLAGFRLIVVGIAVSAMLSSVNTWVLLQVELETAMFASAWGAGSLNGVTPGQVLGASVCLLVLAVGTVFLAPRLKLLDLGDDVAAAVGLRLPRVRAACVAIGISLVCVATAVIGPVAFIALAAPQVAKKLARTAYVPLGASASAGGALLLTSDLLAQHLLPVTLPAGVVTVVVGGAYLVFMLVHEIRRWRQAR